MLNIGNGKLTSWNSVTTMMKSDFVCFVDCWSLLGATGMKLEIDEIYKFRSWEALIGHFRSRTFESHFYTGLATSISVSPSRKDPPSGNW